MLQFTVIAGPNGAGKSTFSGRMSKSDAVIFDPDKEKAILERQYPDISEEAIQTALTDRYNRTELRALAAQKDLTVETNLRNEYLAERAAIFKEGGYQTRLIFMMLPNIPSSMVRVNLRVKQKGHFVDAESIKYNFDASLKNLYKVAGQFDEVMLVCAASDYGIKALPEQLLVIRNGSLISNNEHIPEWALPVVQDIFELLTGQSRDPDNDRSIKR